MKHGFQFISISILILITVTMNSVYAKDYYVSTSGSNSNPGTLSQPFQTIQYGANQLSPGDTLYVRAGTYHEKVTISKSGTPENWITISGYQDERPVIDGQYNLPGGPIGGTDPRTGRIFTYEPLVSLAGNYVVFDGFEVKNSRGRGIRIFQSYTNRAHDIKIKNCWVHDVREAGIMVHDSDNVLVENCIVWHSCDFAPWVDGRSPFDLDWAAGISTQRGSHVTIKGNKVFNNWGEGILPICSNNIHILNNEVYDNYAVQIYSERSSYLTIDGNLVYHTGDPNFLRGGKPSFCIGFADELHNPRFRAESCRTGNINVINNIVSGCSQNLFWWSNEVGQTGFINSLVAHNTFFNGNNLNVLIDAGNHNGCRFENNIIVQDSGTIFSGSGSGISYSNNLWSSAPPGKAQSLNDIIEDPQLLSPRNPLDPGGTDANWFKPKSDSPVVNKGKIISEVTADFFGNSRDSNPDMGAIEFYDGQPPPTSSTTTTLSETTSTTQTTTTSTSTTTTTFLEPQEFEEPDCESGLWIVLNKEGNVLSVPMVRSIKKHNPLEIQPEGHGKVKVIMICFKPDVRVEIFEKTF